VQVCIASGGSSRVRAESRSGFLIRIADFVGRDLENRELSGTARNSTWCKLISGGATLPPRCHRGPMGQLTPTEKQELHQLVDELPPGEIQTARRFLEYLARHQEDDETYTAAQQKRDIEAVAEIERGKGVPHKDVLRDFGL
jgi:hypothetical protein